MTNPPQAHVLCHRRWPLLLFVLLWTGCEVAVVRPLDPATGKAIVEDVLVESDPAMVARTIWTDRLAGILGDRAVDFGTLAAALQFDEEQAIEQYGHREAGRPPSFLVSGRGRVVRVDTTSRVGRLQIDLEPGDGRIDLDLQIGPVVRGTALRDALPFVTFNTFNNQVAYAAVSRELHRFVVDSVLAPLELRSLEGARVTFQGAFTPGTADPALVTPVFLRKEEE